MDQNEKTKNFFDEIAKKQAAIRQIAQQAQVIWKRMGTIPQFDLVKIYLALNQYGEYDPDCRYRERILGYLDDWLIIAEFCNIKMPIRLVRLIEDRLRPQPPPNSGSIDCHGITLTPVPDDS